MYAREKQSRCCGHIDQLYEFMQNAAVHRSYLTLGKHNQNPRNYLRWSFETMVKDKKEKLEYASGLEYYEKLGYASGL